MIAVPEKHRASGDEALAHANILVVDDVPQNLVAMRALLQDERVNVLAAASGAEALELLLQHEVAVAILDVHMPEMSGFALAELMRGSPRTSGIPIVFLTASPQDSARSFRGYDAGAVDFLHKPIEPHVIKSKVSVFVQLHEQRQLLALRAQRLEHALSLNETMLAVITHDLRTPLTVVTLCSEALDRMPIAPDVRVISQRIQRSADRMGRMIEQLLEFSRIRTGVVRMEPRAADLGAVAHQVIDETRQAHPGHAIAVVVNGDLTGSFDADRMAQVLANLLTNAAQHASDGEVRIALDGTAAGWLSIEVSNRGRLDDDLLPRIFEPFKGQLQASSGLGLGLYIVDQFVRGHGGSTRARNEGDGLVVMSARIPRYAKA